MSTEFTSNAGARISEYRKTKRMSQQQLADLIEVSRSYLGDIEAGRSEPSTNFLTSITAKTDVSADWILTGEGKMSKGKSPCAEISPRIARMAELLDGLNEDQQREVFAAVAEKKRLNTLEATIAELLKRTA